MLLHCQSRYEVFVAGSIALLTGWNCSCLDKKQFRGSFAVLSWGEIHLVSLFVSTLLCCNEQRVQIWIWHIRRTCLLQNIQTMSRAAFTLLDWSLYSLYRCISHYETSPIRSDLTTLLLPHQTSHTSPNFLPHQISLTSSDWSHLTKLLLPQYNLT